MLYTEEQYAYTGFIYLSQKRVYSSLEDHQISLVFLSHLIYDPRLQKTLEEFAK